MRKTRSCLLLVTFLSLSCVLVETKPWDLDRLLAGNNNNFGGGLFALPNFNVGINSVKEKLRFLDEGWSFYNKDSCHVACHIFACLFKREPSHQEMCQRPHNKDHFCCKKYNEKPQAAALDLEDRYTIPFPYYHFGLPTPTPFPAAKNTEAPTTSTTTKESTTTTEQIIPHLAPKPWWLTT